MKELFIFVFTFFMFTTCFANVSNDSELGSDWLVRYGTIINDGCPGVYEHQRLVYDAETCTWEWFSYKVDCICSVNCDCTC